ncbi:MAG: GNAT family N-acetyltransferase [Paucibacter sp.]|nr:GNAT family N-acetyltransferase [Roseateles sp.]
MSKARGSILRKRLHTSLRYLFSSLPKAWRFEIYRRMVHSDPAPSERLELKIADTQEELEACFKLLHDAYVGAKFMKPDPSGMRITIYHALPTTTTLCAKFDGKVVGTLSLIREGVFGFPLQSIFDLSDVRARSGQIAEVSALAVHPDFRKTGGAILFPMMKFMRQYCSEYFDTRHLVIAVNPDKIELYEALLFFGRLRENEVESYDFANGAPAVGASLDLAAAREMSRAGYKNRPIEKNIYRYMFELDLPNIKLPQRRYHTTNDPVLTPALLNYFFNHCSPVLDRLDDRKKALLWTIYDSVEYRSVLPMLSGTERQSEHPLRRHRRYSLRCPGQIILNHAQGTKKIELEVIEISFSGLQAECEVDLPMHHDVEAIIQLGVGEISNVHVKAVRVQDAESGQRYYGFKIDEPDPVWRSCVSAFEMGQTHSDLA